MKKEKILEVINSYERWFKENKIPKTKGSHDEISKSKNDILAHCHGMLDEMKIFLKENRINKLYRWLGFIQGCFWSLGIFTLNSLKNANRSDESQGRKE